MTGNSSKDNTAGMSPTGQKVTVPRVATSGPGHVFANYVGALRVKSQQKQRLSLGSYSEEQPAKGFSIELNATPAGAETVVAHIATFGTPERHQLVLEVTNHGNKTVTAQIWQL